jgi:hypothetical protein
MIIVQSLKGLSKLYANHKELKSLIGELTIRKAKDQSRLLIRSLKHNYAQYKKILASRNKCNYF